MTCCKAILRDGFFIGFSRKTVEFADAPTDDIDSEIQNPNSWHSLTFMVLMAFMVFMALMPHRLQELSPIRKIAENAALDTYRCDRCFIKLLGHPAVFREEPLFLTFLDFSRNFHCPNVQKRLFRWNFGVVGVDAIYALQADSNQFFPFRNDLSKARASSLEITRPSMVRTTPTNEIQPRRSENTMADPMSVVTGLR